MVLKRFNSFTNDCIYTVLFWFIVYQLLTYVSSIVLYLLFGKYILDHFPSYFEFIDSVIYLVLLNLFYFVYKKVSLARRIDQVKENGKLRYLFWAVIITFLFRLSVDPIIRIDEIISGDIESIYKSYYLGEIQLIIKFLNIVLLLPILEEIFYRGIFFGFLGNKNNVKYLLISSIFFSIGHINFYPFSYDISNLVLIFIFGLILSFVHLTFGLRYSMLIHILYNLIWYFDTFLTNIFKDAILAINFGVVYWMIIGAAIVFLVFSLIKMYAELKQLKDDC